jgi:type II secretory pathway pseudopilin PulG
MSGLFPRAGRHGRRSGLSAVEVFVVIGIVGVIIAVAVPKFRRTKGDADGATLRAQLASLSAAQESYFRAHQRYSVSLDTLKTQVPSDVALSIREATASGWSATAHHPYAWPHKCAVYSGTAAAIKPASELNAISCD